MQNVTAAKALACSKSNSSTTDSAFTRQSAVSCTRPNIVSLRSLNRSHKLIVQLNRLTRLRGASGTVGDAKQILQLARTSLSRLARRQGRESFSFHCCNSRFLEMCRKTRGGYSSSLTAERKINVCARQRRKLVGWPMFRVTSVRHVFTNLSPRSQEEAAPE